MLVARRMSRDPISISPEASIQEAIELMKTHSIRHLPVVDGQERLVGWVSDTELRGVFIASMIEDCVAVDAKTGTAAFVATSASTCLYGVVTSTGRIGRPERAAPVMPSPHGIGL